MKKLKQEIKKLTPEEVKEIRFAIMDAMTPFVPLDMIFSSKAMKSYAKRISTRDNLIKSMHTWRCMCIDFKDAYLSEGIKTAKAYQSWHKSLALALDEIRSELNKSSDYHIRRMLYEIRARIIHMGFQLKRL
jgi:hypothetical protein